MSLTKIIRSEECDLDNHALNETHLYDPRYDVEVIVDPLALVENMIENALGDDAALEQALSQWHALVRFIEQAQEQEQD